jgi:ferric-dicitrate binding protein FerR (iron transport regulator)
MTCNAKEIVSHELIADIVAEAAEWFIRLEGSSEADKARFANWLTRSPRHVEEFLKISALSHDIAQYTLRATTECSSPDAAAEPASISILRACHS